MLEPNQTSPETFKVSSSTMLGIDLKRPRKHPTFLNSGPSSIEGFDGFVLAGLRVTKPSTKVYRSDCKAANLMLPSLVGTGTLEH
ncbi:Os02g0117750 [Oryza sativa Japonica Group]|uniref:Os02g0117750 protein n=1 Tax=Oryza sativa subsp. japonica TaxID=39947 RepID=A0A0P0VDY4_ORYSJ|nr:hypothetical protein EE612_008473 [Oryza sativa]BAS76672.1 Os02g0117750 [Oryza sativa Japonica Group]